MAKWALIPLLLTACISGSANPPYPLYPATVPAPAPDKVSHLSGYVQFVDGRDVSSFGKSFDLLPGCHEVQTPLSYGHSEMNAGVMYWETGHVIYSMQMKPGYSYVISVSMEKTGGHTYGGQIQATERNADGVVTQTFNPIGRRN